MFATVGALADWPRDERDPHDLPLSPLLSERLRTWQAWGDSRVNLAGPHDSRAIDKAEDRAFDAEGRHLAEQVAAELPDAVATYWKDER